MKRTNVKPLIARDRIRARGVLHFRSFKDQMLYVSTWPKRRGPPKSEIQKAWIQRFTEWAINSKQPDPCAVANAANLAPHTGFWPRDIIHYAGTGRFIYDQGPNGINPPLPYLFLHPPSQRYEGAPRVLTPTVNLKRTNKQDGIAGQFIQILPNEANWDNNNFWSSTLNPARITVRSRGAFAVLASVEMQAVAGGDAFLELRDKNGLRIAGAHDNSNANFAGWLNIVTIVFAEAGDWYDLRAAGLPNGIDLTLRSWILVGITPESIL